MNMAYKIPGTKKNKSRNSSTILLPRGTFLGSPLYPHLEFGQIISPGRKMLSKGTSFDAATLTICVLAGMVIPCDDNTRDRWHASQTTWDWYRYGCSIRPITFPQFSQISISSTFIVHHALGGWVFVIHKTAPTLYGHIIKKIEMATRKADKAAQKQDHFAVLLDSSADLQDFSADSQIIHIISV
jgi:hypothetical protein